MKELHAIISSLSTEEQQQFIYFLEKRNKRKHAKNIDLFKLALKGETDTHFICNHLYGKLNKAAFYVLKQRLYESLIDFVASYKLQGENSIDMQIVKYLLATRDFLLHKNYKIAYKVLDKAEKLAIEYQLFTILSEIYHTKIQYAYALPSINLKEVISAFKANQKNHFLEEELNIVYAKIKHTLKNIQQSKTSITIDFNEIINTIFTEHDINIDNALSFKSLYQLVSIFNISAFVSKNYLTFESFLIETYKILKNKKEKDKQLFYHIRVLFLIANTLFRNKKFKESTAYLQLMYSYMETGKKKYYSNFKLPYNLLLALNLNYTNQQQEAISLLERNIEKKHSDIKTLLDAQLSLIMFYFQANELKKAKQLHTSFYHSDNWYIEKNGIEWTIKKNLIEILLQLELQNIDLFESRLLSFKRKYYEYLQSIKETRVITYLSLVELYYKNPQIVTSKDFYKKVENSFDFIGAKQEDIFVMSFYAWLKGKMIQKPIFKVTLDLIKEAQNNF
ncbi:hypothetical protein [Tenacibaculum sp. 190524A02b]|uniref:hypothetical protein n=1 Tax=Tenacibaculum vairaonense TaxID=3137860 RepID=UPI0031FAC8DC